MPIMLSQTWASLLALRRRGADYRIIDLAFGVGLNLAGWPLAVLPNEWFAQIGYQWLYPNEIVGRLLGLAAIGIGLLLLLPCRHGEPHHVDNYWPLWHNMARITGSTLVLWVGATGILSGATRALPPIVSLLLFGIGLTALIGALRQPYQFLPIAEPSREVDDA